MVSPRKVHTLGSRFSQDLHGIFANPRITVKRIVGEGDAAFSLLAPLIVVVTASIISTVGKHVWADVFFKATTSSIILQIFGSIGRGIWLTLDLFLSFFIYIFWWIGLAIVFHFIGSIVSGRDLVSRRTFFTTLKLAGFAFAPFYFNLALYIFQPLTLITMYWSILIAYWGMRANYETTDMGAFLVVFPYFFYVLLYKTALPLISAL